jgi:SAM-dependent methyltransferase
MTEAPSPSPGSSSSSADGEWHWDRRYAEHPWPSEPDQALVELVEPLAPGAALDLGCGPGRNAIWLARQGWDVTGVDASAVGLAQATRRAADEGVSIRTVQDDLRTYEPAPRSFDLVVLANIHEAEPERSRLFGKAAEAVAPRGHLFVIGHHLESLGRAGPPHPDLLYTEEDLRHAYPGLRVTRLERSERSGVAGEPGPVDLILWAVRDR